MIIHVRVIQIRGRMAIIFKPIGLEKVAIPCCRTICCIMSMSILYVCIAFLFVSVSSSVSGFFFFLFPGTLMKSVVSAVFSVLSVFRNISDVFVFVFSSVCCCVYMMYNVGAYVSVGILFCCVCRILLVRSRV